jgi:nitronate monooxygenase
MRELGPVSHEVPDFPLAAGALAPLRAAAEEKGYGDFSPLWSGQAAPLATTTPAAELTQKFATETLAKLSKDGSN